MLIVDGYVSQDEERDEELYPSRCYTPNRQDDKKPEGTQKCVEVTATRYDEVSNPKHYCNTKYEPIKVIEDWAQHLPPDEVFAFGNALKYIKRYRDKGTPVKDLSKAIWYLEHLKGQLVQKGEK